MLRARWLLRLQELLLCLVAFTIPLPYIFCPPLIIALTLVTILCCNPGELAGNLRHRKVLWPWLIFFLLNAMGYFYSHNKSQSLFDTESKLSFLILPLVIGAGMAVSKDLLQRALLFFIISITCVTLFSFTRAFLFWRQTGHTYQFFYHSLVRDFDANAIYQSLYTLLSLAALLLFPWDKYFPPTRRLLKVLIALVQVTFLVFLSSRTMLLVFFLLLIPLYLASIFRYKRLSVAGTIGIVLAVIGLFVLVFTTNNPIEKRYDQLSQANHSDIWTKKHLNNDDFNNLNIRLFVWHLCFENMNQHHLWLFGAGNGDAQDLQNSKMAEHGVENMYNPEHRSELYNVNLHNEYLQALIMIGLLGLITLGFIVFTPFFYVKNSQFSFFYLFFNLSVCIFMMQESAFQTQAGIIFYTFFAQLFWGNYYLSKNRK